MQIIKKISELEQMPVLSDTANVLVEENGEAKRFPAKALGGGGSAAEADEKYFDIDYDGIVSLKPEYRGHPADASYPYAVSDNGVGVDGSKIDELPEKIVIPDVIAGTAVAGFQAGMFYYNERVKEITIPSVVDELSERFCGRAFNLTAIHNTENITKVRNRAVQYTRITKLIFPKLQEISANAFSSASYLYSIDIGENVTEIPDSTFQQCTNLSYVRGGSKVASIGAKGFYGTHKLKNLSLLNQVTSIGNLAFYESRIQFDWSTIANSCTFGTQATPALDNTADYWSGVNFTPCKNRVGSTLSQTNESWKDLIFGDSGKAYWTGCAVFAILHIHSALSGKTYNHPDEFAEELRAIDPILVSADKHPRIFDNSVYMLNALGYKTTVYKDTITQTAYQAICDALARGAYIYQQVSTYADVNGGHVLMLYGINDIGEMLLVDSNNMLEPYKSTGNIDDGQFYQMPHQNITSPNCDFIIVERK